MATNERRNYKIGKKKFATTMSLMQGRIIDGNQNHWTRDFWGTGYSHNHPPDYLLITKGKNFKAPLQ